MTRFLPAVALTALAGPAFAHSGAHLHPHDGAHWLTLVAGLAMIALAGTLAVRQVKARTKVRK